MNKLTGGTAQAGKFRAKTDVTAGDDVTAVDDVVAGDDLSVADDAVVTGDMTAGTVAVGGGTAIDKILKGTVAVDPGSIATVTRGTIAVTVTGAAVGDVVVMNPPAALDAGLLFVGAYVSGANQVTIMLYNPTGDAVDDTSRTWSYLITSS